MGNAEEVVREIAKAKDLDALQIAFTLEMSASAAFLEVCDAVDWPEALRWLQQKQGATVVYPSAIDTLITNSRLESLKYIHYESGRPLTEDDVRKILLKSKTVVGEWALQLYDYRAEFLDDCLYDSITVGNPRLVKALHQAGGNIGDVFFCKSALSGDHVEVIKYLNSQSIELESMLHMAFKQRKWDIIQECINAHNFDPKKVDWGICLYHALSPQVGGVDIDASIALIKTVLSYKPEIEAYHLYHASNFIRDEPLRLLVEAGVSVDHIYNRQTIERLLEIFPAGSEQAKKLQANLFKNIAFGRLG